MNTTDFYNNIVAENKYRLNVIDKFTDNLKSVYKPYVGTMKDYAMDLYKAISFSTNKVRRDFLKEQGMNANANYHISKSRIDRYNGYKSELANSKSLCDLMLKGKDTYSYLFITLDWIHLTDALDLDMHFDNMKYRFKFLRTMDIYRKITGLFIKHEVAFNIYNGKLTLTPHSHLIIQCNKDDTSAISTEIHKHFAQMVFDIDRDIDIKLINNNEQDFSKVSRYICKDFYYSVFHSRDKITINYSDIIFTLMCTKGFQFINSYGNLKITLS